MRDEQGTVLAYEGTLPNKGQDLLPAPEPAKSYTVDVYKRQDNIDVPSRIPAHEELSGCF